MLSAERLELSCGPLSPRQIVCSEPPLPCAKRNKAAMKDLTGWKPVSFNFQVRHRPVQRTLRKFCHFKSGRLGSVYRTCPTRAIAESHVVNVPAPSFCCMARADGVPRLRHRQLCLPHRRQFALSVS